MKPLKVRQPKQKRALEKKDKIIQVAFQLICEKGYNETNTTEIANKAGVSTGTLYNYFPDKRAIYLEVYALYYNQIALPVREKLKNIKPPFKTKEFIEFILDSTTEHHSVSKHVHDEMMMLVNTEEDFGLLHRRLAFKMVCEVVSFCEANGLQVKNMLEKFHIFNHILDLYAHEIVYYKTEGLNYCNIRDTLVSCMLYMMME